MWIISAVSTGKLSLRTFLHISERSCAFIKLLYRQVKKQECLLIYCHGAWSKFDFCCCFLKLMSGIKHFFFYIQSSGLHEISHFRLLVSSPSILSFSVGTDRARLYTKCQVHWSNKLINKLAVPELTFNYMRWIKRLDFLKNKLYVIKNLTSPAILILPIAISPWKSSLAELLWATNTPWSQMSSILFPCSW